MMATEWRSSPLILAAKAMPNAAEMLVTLVIALALVFFIMRPLLKRVLSPEQQPLALPVSAEIGGPTNPAGMQQMVTMPAEAAGDGGHDRVPTWMADARQAGNAQAQTMKTVGTLVQDNPKQAALIVRDWLSSAV